MKVKVRVFNSKGQYKSGGDSDREENKDSIRKGIDFCREEMAQAGDRFIGFYIETLRGELKHKINNGLHI